MNQTHEVIVDDTDEIRLGRRISPDSDVTITITGSHGSTALSLTPDKNCELVIKLASALPADKTRALATALTKALHPSALHGGAA